MAAPPLLAPAGGTTLAGTFAQLAATYALMRCLLDPSVQWVALAGVAFLAAPIGAFLQGASSTVLAGLGVLSLAMITCRIATAERCEPRARVVRASVISVALAWVAALVIALLVSAASHLPSAQAYSAAAPPPQSATILTVAAPVAPQPTGPLAGAVPLAGLPIAAVLLAAVRPWRRQRRYTDAGWLATLLCLGVPLWLAWDEPGGVFMTPVAALLAGASWDETRAPLARHAATAVVLLQVAVALALWPHYPGGVRAGAWLPMPGIATDGGLRAAP